MLDFIFIERKWFQNKCNCNIVKGTMKTSNSNHSMSPQTNSAIVIFISCKIKQTLIFISGVWWMQPNAVCYFRPLLIINKRLEAERHWWRLEARHDIYMMGDTRWVKWLKFYTKIRKSKRENVLINYTTIHSVFIVCSIVVLVEYSVVQ